jgi:hypothetical protein
MTRAGLPATMEFCTSIELANVVDAATITPSAMSTPFRIVALQPIQTWLPILIGCDGLICAPLAS